MYNNIKPPIPMSISNTQFVHTFNTENKYSSGYHILQDNREVKKRLCDSFSESYHEEPSEVWRTNKNKILSMADIHRNNHIASRCGTR